MDFTSARLNMVESQVRTSDVTDVELVDAMRHVRREAFCPANKAHLAYAEAEVEYAPGRYLLTPRDVGKLLYALRPRAGERALATCAPYAAALLARMGLQVTALEPAEDDARVRAMLADEGVQVVGGDLRAPSGTYDVVVAEGAVAEMPDGWVQALAPGGRLGAVVRQGVLGRAQVYTRGGDGVVGRRSAFDATASYIRGFEPQASFVF